MNVVKWCGAAGSVVLASAVLAACGSSDDGSGATTTAAASPAKKSAAAVKYSGPESTGVAQTVPAPTQKSGATFKVGFLNPEASVPSLVDQQNAVKQEVEALGGTFIAKNAASSVSNQNAQFQELLAQGVNAIVFQPIDPKAIRPFLEQAQKRNVTMVTISAPATAGEPNLTGVTTNFLYGSDSFAWAQAADAAGRAPGAKVGIVASSAPVPGLQYTTTRQKHWAQELGLDVAGSVTAQQDTPASAASAASTLLTQHPDIKVILAYNDGSAEGAAGAVRSAGKSGVLVYGSGGEDKALAEVKSGQMAGTAVAQQAAIGKEAADAAYNAVTKQNTPLPTTVLAPGQFITTRGVFPPTGPLTFG
jgi:ribose transport system substrate-binding protein